MRLLFIFCLISINLKAQTLYKVVNGVKVEFSAADYIQWRADSVDNIAKINQDSAIVRQARQIRNSIITAAQTAVGVRFDSLSLIQLRALEGILLFKEGAIDTNRRIKPLIQWIK